MMNELMCVFNKSDFAKHTVIPFGNGYASQI